MDKKNTIIGVLLLLASFYFMYDYSSKEAELAKHRQAQSVASVTSSPTQHKNTPAIKIDTTEYKDSIAEKTQVLENKDIKVVFTNKGGSIKDVELLKYFQNQDEKTPYIFNDVKNSLPAMTAAFYDESSFLPKPMLNSFVVTKKTDSSITYEFANAKFKIIREYAIVQENKDNFQPYTILAKTTIKNLTEKALSLKEISFYLGVVPPTESDVYGSNLAFVLYNTDNDTVFSRSSAFLDSSGFLGIGASQAKPFEKINEPAKWVSIKNQFFAAVYTPYKAEASSGIALPVTINASNDNKYMKNAIGGFINFDVPVIEPQKEWSIEGAYFVGPKELERLYSLGSNQESIMDYGWFGFVSRPLSRLLNWIHSWIEVVSPDWGWGWSIIILTLVVRLVMWPLTSIQIKSSQRMTKMQGPLKEIREKFKDDPKKVQQETMKIYSEYGINPLAGCFPVFIQIPIFIGLYYMLQTSCEIRFAHFLWIDDLSLPDTIEALPSIFGIPLHILPLLNALVTFIQMHLTPTPSTDKTQAFMFKLMPVIMLVFFYTFPSGLVLYWLVQSLLGIVQAIIIRRGADKVELKKRSKPGFMQRLQEAMEQAQAQQQARGPEFDKLPLRERIRIAKEDAMKAKRQRMQGMGNQERKKNPGGRSTKPKRR
ncbi:MAG: membrane protein insertase YidC [Opitutales bacterium]|nr:membrane protein insertase YidC [Opitutales bacterium]